MKKRRLNPIRTSPLSIFCGLVRIGLIAVASGAATGALAQRVADVDLDLSRMEHVVNVPGETKGSGGGGLLGDPRDTRRLGVSRIDVFGLTAQTERVLFVVSAHPSMVYESKGGLETYQVIKNQIVATVGGLSAGTLFNVVLHDGRLIRTFKPQLVPAGRGVTNELRAWIQPVNSSLETLGLGSGGRVPEIKNEVKRFPELTEALGQRRNNHNHARLVQYILETGADTIFEITDHHPGFGGFLINKLSEQRRERAREAYRKAMEDPEIQAQLQAYNKERAEVQRQINEAYRKLKEDRRARGLPVFILEGSFIQQARFFGLEMTTRPPSLPDPDPGWTQLEDRLVNRYFREYLNEYFRHRGMENPTVNVILFLGSDEILPIASANTITEYVRFFRGQVRALRAHELDGLLLPGGTY